MIDLIYPLNKSLLYDLKQVANYFPKLKPFFHKNKLLYLEGYIDICDSKNEYWESFKLKILIPKNYPFDIPIVINTDDSIIKDDEFHIDENGVICVAMKHKLIPLAKKGLTLIKFLKEILYSRLSNHLYFKYQNEWLNGDYKHREDGIIQFYQENLNNIDILDLKRSVEFVVNKEKIQRNSKCFCGSSKKIKKCHLNIVQFIKKYDFSNQLQEDLKAFDVYNAKVNQNCNEVMHNNESSIVQVVR